MQKKIIIILSGILALQFACARERVSVGHGDPEAEMQKCIKLSEKKKFEEAIECLEILKSKYPQTGYGEVAELRIGDAYYRKKEYLLAADAYEAFTKLHPNHEQSDYAYYRLGLSYLKESPKAIDRDQQYLADAIKYFEIALFSFPSSTYAQMIKKSLSEARERVAKRHFYIGRFYYRTGEYIAAIPRFVEIVNEYPDSELAANSLYRIVIASIKLSRLDDAKEAYNLLSNRFPNHELTKRAESKLLNAVPKGD